MSREVEESSFYAHLPVSKSHIPENKEFNQISLIFVSSFLLAQFFSGLLTSFFFYVPSEFDFANYHIGFKTIKLKQYF